MKVIALAGRRIDAPDAPVARFPLECVPAVQEALRALFHQLGAEAIVASGACGTDLLALEIAEREHLPYAIVLPFGKRRFRQESVIDRPGEWAPIFDAVTLRARDAGRLKISRPSQDAHQDFLRTNDRILKQALNFMAGEDSSPAEVAAVVVWDGQSRGPGDATEDFKRKAEQKGIPIYQVLTTSTLQKPESSRRNRHGNRASSTLSRI